MVIIAIEITITRRIRSGGSVTAIIVQYGAVYDIYIAIIINIAEQCYPELGFGGSGIAVSNACDGDPDGYRLAGI